MMHAAFPPGSRIRGARLLCALISRAYPRCSTGVIGGSGFRAWPGVAEVVFDEAFLVDGGGGAQGGADGEAEQVVGAAGIASGGFGFV